MALFKVKTSKKVETQLRLEESTAKMLDRYAHFHEASADDVANQALEYIFERDTDFKQYLQQNPNAKVPSTLRIKKPAGTPKGAASDANGNGNHAPSSTPAAPAIAK